MEMKMIRALILVIVAMGFVGTEDYEAQLAQEKFYAKQVCKGRWPDYKAQDPVCPGTTEEAAGDFYASPQRAPRPE